MWLRSDPCPENSMYRGAANNNNNNNNNTREKEKKNIVARMALLLPDITGERIRGVNGRAKQAQK